MNFEVAPGASIDRANRLQIFLPRMEPTAEANGMEYQYRIYCGDVRYGLGFFGTATLMRQGGQPEQVFTLNLGHPSVIDSILQLKRDINIEEDDATFLEGIVRGLVRVFASRTGNDEPVTYRAISDPSVLQARGLVISLDAQTQPIGELVLAEIRIPAHPITYGTPLR